MAHRHKKHKKAEGGGVAPKHDPDKKEYNAQGSNVMKEAHEEKRGGKVKHKASGGEVKAPGKASGGRLDKRARGGGVSHYSKHDGTGKDMTHSPFSAAHVKPSTAGGNPHPQKHKGE